MSIRYHVDVWGLIGAGPETSVLIVGDQSKWWEPTQDDFASRTKTAGVKKKWLCDACLQPALMGTHSWWIRFCIDGNEKELGGEIGGRRERCLKNPLAMQRADAAKINFWSGKRKAQTWDRHGWSSIFCADLFFWLTPQISTLCSQCRKIWFSQGRKWGMSWKLL